MSEQRRPRLELDGLFGPGVATSQLWLDQGGMDELFPSEMQALGSARPARVAEFRAGRHCAREALSALGFPRVAIPRLDDRSPEWPAGVTASITHVSRGPVGFAAAAAARLETHRALGLDVELDTPLDARLWHRVLTPVELDRLSAVPEPERGRIAKAVFCAKESVYKAQYPLTGTYLGFSDVELAWSNEEFEAHILDDGARRLVGHSLRGRIVRGAGLVASALTLPSA